MMFRQSPRRQQRNKGMRVKHVVQVCLLLGACIWLLFYQYQMDHHSSSQHGINLSKKLSDASDIKLGRKDLKPKAAAAAGEAQDEKQNAGSQPEGSQPEEAEPEHGGTSPDAKKERPKHNVGEHEESKKKSKHIQDKEEEDRSKEKDKKAEKHKKKSAEKEEPEGENDNKTKEKEAESKKKEKKEKNESKEKETKEKKDAAEEKDNGEKASKAGAKKENQGTESEISPNSQQTGLDYDSSPTTAPADDKKHKMHTMKKISSSSDQNSSTEAQMDLDTLP